MPRNTGTPTTPSLPTVATSTGMVPVRSMTIEITPLRGKNTVEIGSSGSYRTLRSSSTRI